MRVALFASLVLFAAPLAAKPLVPLAPPVGAEHLYEGGGPRPLTPAHVLYRRIAVAPITGMPARVGTTFLSFAKPAAFDEAVKTAFEQANLLAPPGTAPAANLSITWNSLSAPAKIGTRSRAEAVISYVLRRADNGQVIFAREIRTESRAQGGLATDRVKGNARMAIQRNIAAAIACLDKAAYGLAPPDCALGFNGQSVSRRW